MVIMKNKKSTPIELVYNERIISILVAFCILCLFALRSSQLSHSSTVPAIYSELLFIFALPMLVASFFIKGLNLKEKKYHLINLKSLLHLQ